MRIQTLRRAGVGIVRDLAPPFAPELARVLVEEVSPIRSFRPVRHGADRRSERMARPAAALAGGLRAEVARSEALVRLTEASRGRQR